MEAISISWRRLTIHLNQVEIEFEKIRCPILKVRSKV